MACTSDDALIINACFSDTHSVCPSSISRSFAVLHFDLVSSRSFATHLYDTGLPYFNGFQPWAVIGISVPSRVIIAQPSD